MQVALGSGLNISKWIADATRAGEIDAVGVWGDALCDTRGWADVSMPAIAIPGVLVLRKGSRGGARVRHDAFVG